MNIVYVEYDLGGPNRMPWSAAPDKDGIVWMPYLRQSQQDSDASIPSPAKPRNTPSPTRTRPCFTPPSLHPTAACGARNSAPTNSLVSIPRPAKSSNIRTRYLPARKAPSRAAANTPSVSVPTASPGPAELRSAASIPRQKSSSIFRTAPTASPSTRTTTPGSPNIPPSEKSAASTPKPRRSKSGLRLPTAERFTRAAFRSTDDGPFGSANPMPAKSATSIPKPKPSSSISCRDPIPAPTL